MAAFFFIGIDLVFAFIWCEKHELTRGHSGLLVHHNLVPDHFAIWGF
jgi:hypothetical protein